MFAEITTFNFKTLDLVNFENKIFMGVGVLGFREGQVGK